MRTIGICALAAALVMAVTFAAVAQEKTTGKPGVVVAALVVATATVEAIDYAKRTMTPKGPEGHTRTVKVDQTVKNFDEVKRGDQVTAEYYDAVAIFLRTAQEQPTAGEAGASTWHRSARNRKS